MTEDLRREHLARFYGLLDELNAKVGGLRILGQCDGYQGWPSRGVYFFFESGQMRTDSGEGHRVVRVGTHALKAGSATSLWNRLSQHRGVRSSGGGNHRGSIFRLIVGAAIARRDRLDFPTWGKGSSAPRAIRDQEVALERKVSQVIGDMSFLWLPVEDAAGPDSLRGYVERNAIALLSNAGRKPIDPPSQEWLGHHSDRDRVRASGLWNQNHVDEDYDPAFLLVLRQFVTGMRRTT